MSLFRRLCNRYSAWRVGGSDDDELVVVAAAMVVVVVVRALLNTAVLV